MAQPRHLGDTPQSVAMLGQFGIGNLGNEATLAAALEAAARVLPFVRVTTICPDPMRVEGQHGVPGVSIYEVGRLGRIAEGGRFRRLALTPIREIARWVFAVRHLRHIDVLVVPGTGILDDFGSGPTGLPLTVARWSAAARITRTRLVFLSIGAGPSNNPMSRFLMRFAAAQAEFCSYRDWGSRQFMESIGRCTAEDEVWPDLVFALDRDPPKRQIRSSHVIVALGIMNYRGWRHVGVAADRIHESYVARMVTLADQLQAAGYKLFLVIGDQYDLAVAEEVSSRLRDSSVEIARSPDFDDLCAVLANADVLISSRYHNLVAALLSAVPPVSLSYMSHADKNDQLMEAFGLGTYCQHVESFDISVALAHVDAILSDRRRLAIELRRRVAAVKAETRQLLDCRTARLMD
jgi:polysaccharide pyruvyl transferase WcaK-like protein